MLSNKKEFLLYRALSLLQILPPDILCCSVAENDARPTSLHHGCLSDQCVPRSTIKQAYLCGAGNTEGQGIKPVTTAHHVF